MADPDPNAPVGNDALLAALAPEIHKLINGALASHNKQADKKRTEDRDAFAKLLDEKLSGFKPTEKPTEEPPVGKKEAANAELATLRKQMEALATKAEASERRSAQLREQNRQASLRDGTAKFLANAGIVGDRFDAAYAYLAHNGKIKVAEDPDSDAQFFVDTTEDLALETGLAGWLKSEQAKIFLPPTGVRGSGSRPGGGNGFGQQKITPEQTRTLLAQRLEAELGK